VTRLLFLDFDGVLHPVSALQGFERRLTRDEVIRTGRLFRWADIVDDLLDGHDDVQVAVHSSWRWLARDHELRAYLGPLSHRFIGATPRDLARWPSIQHVVTLTEPAAWLALDDDASQFPQPLPPHIVICDPEHGAWAPGIRRAVVSWLGRSFSQ